MSSRERTNDDKKKEAAAKLRRMLLDGAASGPATVIDRAYFDRLRKRVRQRASAHKRNSVVPK